VRTILTIPGYAPLRVFVTTFRGYRLPVKVLAISGSLRSLSSNTALLEAAALVAPGGVEVVLWRGLASLPHFSPDDDVEPAPDSVAAFRKAVAEADALLVSTPEYAHGIPGVLKNALDWLVSGPEIIGKPVAFLNPSPRSTHAQASLREILSVMSTRIVDAAFVTLPLGGRAADAANYAADPAVALALRNGLAALSAAASTAPPA
jgi:NAD(P)H-dependent FMN reductase